MNVVVRQSRKSIGLSRDNSLIHTKARIKRMRDMVRLLNLPDGARIVDLGGNEFNWNLIDHKYHVTLVNLPGTKQSISNPAVYEAVEGDACDLKGVFADQSFDASFSNSVIEHVAEDKQAMFAEEARRLAPAYWVQTPSPLFPIEAHTGIWFYWNRTQKMRDAILDRLSKKFPGWVVMLRETRVLSSKRMRELFPDGKLYRETYFGLEKSNSMYRPYPAH